MRDELIELKERLQLERTELTDRLQEIDANLGSINRVLSLVDGQKANKVDKQMPLIKTNTEQPVSLRFKNLTFHKSIKILFDENPGKLWKPAELADAVLQEGFKTNSINFKNTVRTLLMNLRKANKINATKLKSGWLYGATKKDHFSYTDETESLNRDGKSNEASESSKHPEPSY